MELPLNEIIYLFIAFSTVTLLVLAWPRRKIYGGFFFVLSLVGLIIWDLGLLSEAINTTESLKILSTQISYIGFVFVTPFLFLFITEYTSQKKAKTQIVYPIMIIPTLVLVAAWTNQWHHLLWTGFYWGSKQLNTLVYNHGIIFFVFAIYLLLLIFIGLFILLKGIRNTQPPVRSQLIIIAAGVSFPIISAGMYVFGIDPVPGMDISIFGFLITGLILAYGFERYYLLDLVPIAKGTLLEHFKDGIIVIDRYERIFEINQNAIELLDISRTDLLGKKLDEILPWKINPTELCQKGSIIELSTGQAKIKYLDLHVSSLTPASVHPVGYLLVFRDITELKEANINLSKTNQDLQIQIEKINQLQIRLKDQALHDSLTNLYNRRAIDEIIKDQFYFAKQQNRPFSIAMLDIDHYKRINDIYGHLCGDSFLQEYSKVVKSAIRKNDIACRIGGDEILMAFLDMNQEEVTKKAEEILKLCSQIYIEQNLARISTTVSIGVAAYPTNGQSITELIRNADEALYAAKAGGRNMVKQAVGISETKTLL